MFPWKFLTATDTVIDTLGFHKASKLLEYGFPLAVGSPEVVARLDEWLADNNAPKGAQRFVAEVRLARRVTHPSVCRIHEYGEDGGIRFIVMRRPSGPSRRWPGSRRGAPPSGARRRACATSSGESVRPRPGPCCR